MERRKIEQLLDQKNKLIKYIKQYPLSVALLWVPHCHNWKGIKDERRKGCGNPMRRIKGDLFKCDDCNITEHRTSQQHSLLNLGEEATLISGGNRAGKTEIGACLSVAFASGRKEQYVQEIGRAHV